MKYLLFDNEITKGIFIVVVGGLILNWSLRLDLKFSNNLLFLLEKKINFSISISVLFLFLFILIIITTTLIFIMLHQRKLKILKAIYGNPPKKIDDVTNALRKNIDNNKLKMLVSNKMKGYHEDPSPGKPKLLIIDYSYKNRKHKKTYKEGEIFKLP